MRVPTNAFRHFRVEQIVPETITMRGYVYTLRSASGFSKELLRAEYRLRCR